IEPVGDRRRGRAVQVRHDHARSRARRRPDGDRLPAQSRVLRDRDPHAAGAPRRPGEPDRGARGGTGVPAERRDARRAGGRGAAAARPRERRGPPPARGARPGTGAARAAGRRGARGRAGRGARGVTTLLAGLVGLLGLVRHLRQGGEVALTPDGPRGPAERMKPGALAAAQHANALVIAAGARTSSAWWIQSWDRFCLPWPFAVVDIVYSPPFAV